MNRTMQAAIGLVMVIAFSACATSTPIPTPAPAPTGTATSTATVTLTATLTRAPTFTPSPTQTPSPTLVFTPIPVPAAYPMHLEKVGQFGGETHALALSGDIVYLQAGPRMVMVDVSDPSRPTQIGRSQVLPGSVKSIAALDHYALVGDGEGTLWIFDVPASGNPQVISKLEIGGIVSDIVVSGGYAYLAARVADLQIVDVSNPLHPKIAGALQLEGEAFALAMTGNLLTLESRPPLYADPSIPEAATNLIGVSNVEAPELLRREEVWFAYHDFALPSTGLVVDNIQIYPSHDIGYMGLEVRDASDPQSPTYVDDALEPLGPGEIIRQRGLAFRERWVYVAAEYGLEIYDVGVAPERDPALGLLKWKQVGWFQTDIGTMRRGCCAQWYHGEILNLGDHLYTFTRREAFIWSLTDAANPTLIRPLDRPFAEWSSITIPVHGGIILEDYLRDGAYSVLDTQNPSAATITKVLLSQAEGYIMAVDRGRLLYCSGPDVQIFDIADPYHPHLLGTHRLSTGLGEPLHLRFLVIGELVFITSKEPSSGGIVLDISDPSNPFEANVPWPAFLAPVEYLSDGESHFQAPEVLIHGDTIFTTRANNLLVYAADNLNTPLAAIEVPIASRTDEHLPYSRLSYIDGRLYVRTNLDVGPGLSQVSVGLVNVDDPARPQLLAHWELVDHPATSMMITLPVAVYKDYWYVGMNNGGVVIFKLVPN